MEITYRDFEPADLEAVRLLSYMTDDYIPEDPDMVVAVRDHDIIAAAGLTDKGDNVSEIKPLLFKQGVYDESLLTNLIKVLEKHAKIETVQVLVIDILRTDTDQQYILESLGYSADPAVKQGRTKFIEYRKEINYFRQHDLAL